MPNKENSDFFRLVNKRREPYTNKLKSCKDREGYLVADKSDGLKEWRNYFNNLNNRNEVRTKEEGINRSQLEEQEMEAPDKKEIE